ncbi:Uncharacterised protein [Mycobacteroides abscessus subsp. abscessus]|nr:Uncharacterised protein [Mycobacteroides abscessus subsp. abscessus]
MVAHLVDAVASGHLADGADGGNGLRGVGAHRDGSGYRLRGVAPVGAAGHAQRHRGLESVRAIDLFVVDPPLGRRTTERRIACRIPVDAALNRRVGGVAGGARDRFAGARAAHRVADPARTRSHPDDLRSVERGRGDQDVVAVGDHRRIGVACQAFAESSFDHVDLSDAVELVA